MCVYVVYVCVCYYTKTKVNILYSLQVSKNDSKKALSYVYKYTVVANDRLYWADYIISTREGYKIYRYDYLLPHH